MYSTFELKYGKEIKKKKKKARRENNVRSGT